MTTAPVFLAPEAVTAAVGDRVWLSGPEGRHAVAVRRLRVGEGACLTDGAGRGVVGTVTAVEGRDRLALEVVAARTDPVPEPSVTVVQALPKGDRGERAVETMTETGVDVVVPWSAARCVTRWKDERGAKSLARWRQTAREAGKQARRLRFPEVTEPVTTAELAATVAGAELAVVLHEDGAEPLSAVPLPDTGRVVLVVGPEGGVTPDELATLGDAGARRCRLGPTVLRSSTAGTAALAAVLTRTARWS